MTTFSYSVQGPTRPRNQQLMPFGTWSGSTTPITSKNGWQSVQRTWRRCTRFMRSAKMSADHVDRAFTKIKPGLRVVADAPITRDERLCASEKPIDGEQVETLKPMTPTPWKWVDPKDVSPREF